MNNKHKPHITKKCACGCGKTFVTTWGKRFRIYFDRQHAANHRASLPSDQKPKPKSRIQRTAGKGQAHYMDAASFPQKMRYQSA